jgi:2-polyprenyl-3-methyl-5-hydroxy-6-metoxy-1,4-benzoquinol methylase
MALTEKPAAIVEAYDQWHTAIGAAEEVPTPTAPWHLMARRHLGDVQGLRVLEIGCGLGAFANYLAEAGATVVAADFSPAAVAYASRLLAPRGGTAVVADVQDLPFEDGAFDLVISLDTLEHVPRPSVGLAELVRVTRPGGRLVITTPNYLSLMGLCRALVWFPARLVGKRYGEMGQPLNKPIMAFRRVRRLRKLGCRVDAFEGTLHLLSIPGFTTRVVRILERPSLQRFAYHSCTVATRLR